jgi:hypothetical protein
VRDAQGNSDAERLSSIKDAARGTEGCLSIRQQPTALGTDVIIAFRSEDTRAEAIAKLSGPQGKAVLHEYTDEQREAVEKRTVKLRGIPLNTTKEQVIRGCSKLGPVYSGNVMIRGNWLEANIQFGEEEVVKRLIDQWSFFLSGDRVNVFPFRNWQQVADERRKYELKLVGMPKGITAQWLAKYIEEVRGKTCLVPRDQQSYLPRSVAYVAFASAEDRDNALKAGATHRRRSHTQIRAC